MSYILIAYVIFSSPAGAEKKGPKHLLNPIKRGAAFGNVKRRGDAFNPILKVPQPQPQIDKKVGSDNKKNLESSTDAGSNKAEDTNTTTNGKSSRPPNQPITTNENSQAGAQQAESNLERNLPPGNQGGGMPPGGQLQHKPLWMPMCFFFDPETTESYARETIKTVVDDFAGCGIAVQVHSATIRHGYDKDNPDSLNAAAKYHCPWQNISGDDVKYGATQTHPDSIKASDKMCDSPAKIKDKEAERAPWDVAGCAAMAEGVSIVDKGAGGATASHEEGHAVAQNSKLENLGEKGIVKTDAGRGLQLVSSPKDKTKEQEEAPEGTEGKSGYTPEGCQALRSGANDNSQRKVKYNPNGLESYYHQEGDPEKMVDFHATGKPRFFAPKEYPNIVGKEPPIKPNERALAQDQSSPFSLARAESGHRRKKEKRLTLRESGKPVTGSITPNKKTEAVTRGDDSLPEGGGSPVRGGGKTTDNDTIVANKDLSLLAGPEKNETKFDPNFFSNDDKNSSSSNNNSNPNSSPDSKSKSLTQVAESDSLLDRDFFSKQPKESLTERRRKPPRVSLAVTEKSVPETRKEIIDQKENRVRALRTQVSFE
ncbi:MAG: hypothetical protein HQ462_02455 [Deltaproteobacteria bacterium]|nr:hypothetical protein [Deltaproteobacteria bacterium]